MAGYGTDSYGAGVYGAAPTPSTLTLSVACDFSSGYEDISDDASRMSQNVGRQSEFDETTTGSSITVLDNSTRKYDSTYTGSPHYPNLLPGKKIQHRASLNGVGVLLFTGFVDPDDGWPQAWELPLYQETQVRTFDGFSKLSRFDIPAGTVFPEELSGARLNRLLDLVGWPAADRVIDAGQETIQAAEAGALDDQNALRHAFDVALTEPGFVFVDGGGAFVFHDRHHRLKAPYTVAQAVYSDDPAAGEFLYSQLTMQQSKIVNVWRVTRNGGVEQVAEDAASIDAYDGRFEDSVSTLHVDDATAANYAQWRLSQTKDPHQRFVSMVVELLDDDSLWWEALSRKLGDRVTVKRTPPGASEQIVQDGHMEAITRDLFSLEAGTPSVTFALSPADQLTYWSLDDPVASVLDSTTRLAY